MLYIASGLDFSHNAGYYCYMPSRLVIISDTHTQHRKVEVPEGDVLIHCGDISFTGELPVIEDFAKWMKELPHPNKITIFGNHEVGMEHGYKRASAIDMIKDAGIHYLEDSGIEIGGIKFWGSPIQPWFHSWEFNRQRGKDIKHHWDMVDPLTQCLISHGPPYGILDEVPRGIHGSDRVGCEDLLRRIDELKQLKVHCFGHIHREHNEAPVERNGVMFCNASVLNNAYKLVNDPIVIDL
jgi:Icc-related predicted phosphoesterase